MKSFIAVFTAALAAQGASAHYMFQSFAQGSGKGTAYQYVRKNTNNNSPVLELNNNDLRCNVGGATGGSTSTIELAAGSQFTFALDQAVYHQGPVSLYASKAPSTAATYDGSGDWFKFYQWGPSFSGGSSSWPMRDTYTGTIPSCIPAGEYLIRIESLAIHNPGSTPQFYISCAQVKVTGGGSKTPSITTKIPGHVKASDPGYTANIYNNFNSYTVPGPAVWSC